MMDKLRAKIVELCLDELRKAITNGKVDIKSYPTIGSVLIQVHNNALSAETAKLFAAL